MIEYIKIIIMSIFTGVLLPLPTSAAAHYSYLNIVLDFSESEEVLGFYYSVMTLVFSALIFVFFRKIYITSLKNLVNRNGENKNKDYRNLIIGTALSLPVSLVLCIPVSTDRLLMDYFDLFLKGNGMLLTALASIISGALFITAFWYTSKSDNPKIKLISVKSSLRLSFYQLFSYVIPGLSHICTAGTNLLISDIEPGRLMAHIYTYMAPQMFFISIIKIIRGIAGEAVINPVSVIICVVVSALASWLFMSLSTKVNMKKLMVFFSIYSVIIGLFIAVGSFII